MDGGEHAFSGGGYTAGIGETCEISGVNGECNYSSDRSGAFKDSGGYYTYKSPNALTVAEQTWFGRGGCWATWSGSGMTSLWSTAGSGGTAGKGGKISYSKDVTINSYNGNRITEDDFDYSKICYEYDKDGNLTDIEVDAIQVKNTDKKIIPAKIFIQDGIKRAVYASYEYMTKEDKIKYNVNEKSEVRATTSDTLLKIVKIIDENLEMPHSRQGIGSGAGYIELDNGSYELLQDSN